MHMKDVLRCSFPNWYSRFKKVTPRSVILPLPQGFVDYLLADGVVLPKSCNNEYPSHDADSDNDEKDVWEDSDGDSPEAPSFEEFDQKIRDSIAEFGGKVFPKLNWSSPRDATWIALNNSCCCTTLADVYLLLKSSDFIVHDVTQPFLLCEDFDSNIRDAGTVENQVTPFYLVLRDWIEINPDTEFRCFVRDGTLIGITQRDLTMYSDYNVTHKGEIVSDIVSFFNERIKRKFDCQNYVFDIVRKKKDDVYLLDFNPFGSVTDSLLFEWDELTNGDLTTKYDSLPDYRCIDHNQGIQPRPFSYYAIPKDIVDITTGEDSHKFVDLLKLRMNKENNSSSDEEQ